jgi:hypothetical protein
MQRQLRLVLVMLGAVCSSAMAQQVAKKPLPGVTPPASSDPYLFDIVKKPAYARALKNLLTYSLSASRRIAITAN